MYICSQNKRHIISLLTKSSIMKKVSLLLAMIAFVCGNVFAQMSYDFNDCPAGAKIAQTLGEPWTTWSEAPGSAEDGVFAEQGSMACYFTYGNDQIFKLNGLTTGRYSISFNMYIPDGKDAYNNLLHVFNGSGSEWATEVYYKTTSNGTSIQAGGVTTTFECPFDEWFNVKYDINLDGNYASFAVDGVEICNWDFSLQATGGSGTRQIDAIDFYPPTNSTKSMYYIDNLEVMPIVDEQVLIDDDFEAYNLGSHIAVEAIAAGNDWWTTWTNSPGSNEDGIIAEAGGSKCGYISGANDNVLLLGGQETGIYDLEFAIYCEEGKYGYFNILHEFAGSNSKWAMQAYLNATNDGTTASTTYSVGHGTVHAGANSNGDIPAVVGEWMYFRINVDLDADIAELFYRSETSYPDEISIVSWQWSLDSFGQNVIGRKMDAMDFYAPNATVGCYYLDNFKYTKIGGESAPHLDITPDAINETLIANDLTTVDITINNTGNSIGDWMGWVDFGQGPDGTAGTDLMYHNGTVNTGIGSSDSYTREMAIRLTPEMYAGAAMGKKLVSAQYMISSSYAAADGNYTFRVYGQGLNNQPGELLAEKTVSTSDLGVWITATFDEDVYMTGQAIWVAVGLAQTAGEYPMSMDGGINPQEFDGNWLSTNGGTFSHCWLDGDSGFQGAWMITAHCEGTAIPGTWANLSTTDGSIMGGQSETITLNLNSIGLANGEYEANVIFNTNDEDAPHFEIPVKLTVGDVSVAENNNAMAAIYPNPASSMVTVEGENLNTVAIYNVAGQLLRIVKLDNALNTIEMNVEAGVYFFSIYDNDGNNVVQRVVITK